MKYLVDAAKMKAIDEYTSNMLGIPRQQWQLLS